MAARGGGAGEEEDAGGRVAQAGEAAAEAVKARIPAGAAAEAAAPAGAPLPRPAPQAADAAAATQLPMKRGSIGARSRTRRRAPIDRP
jgi:hypothetical protein